MLYYVYVILSSSIQCIAYVYAYTFLFTCMHFKFMGSYVMLYYCVGFHSDYNKLKYNYSFLKNEFEANTAQHRTELEEMVSKHQTEVGLSAFILYVFLYVFLYMYVHTYMIYYTHNISTHIQDTVHSWHLYLNIYLYHDAWAFL